MVVDLSQLIVGFFYAVGTLVVGALAGTFLFALSENVEGKD
jgi:hypothetical protein